MLHLTLVNSFRSGIAPKLLSKSCSIIPKSNPVSNFTSVSKGFIRLKPQNQSNNQYIRKYSRGDRSDTETARSHVKSGPTLKERMMAPPSENGKLKNEKK